MGANVFSQALASPSPRLVAFGPHHLDISCHLVNECLHNFLITYIVPKIVLCGRSARFSLSWRHCNIGVGLG
jgi:hypothetical protein